jgi:hypothetical protein
VTGPNVKVPAQGDRTRTQHREGADDHEKHGVDPFCRPPTRENKKAPCLVGGLQGAERAERSTREIYDGGKYTGKTRPNIGAPLLHRCNARRSASASLIESLRQPLPWHVEIRCKGVEDWWGSISYAANPKPATKGRSLADRHGTIIKPIRISLRRR